MANANLSNDDLTNRVANLLNSPRATPFAFVRGTKLACHLSEWWDAAKFRAYVELMHAPGCRSGNCRGCAR